MIGLACVLVAFGVFVLPFILIGMDALLAHEREMERIRLDPPRCPDCGTTHTGRCKQCEVMSEGRVPS